MPLRVAALRLTSREIVLGGRPSLRAMALMPIPLIAMTMPAPGSMSNFFSIAFSFSHSLVTAPINDRFQRKRRRQTQAQA
ncbi:MULTISPECIES: hypothetical protein [unclassified Mesorhizobium]|uniref:hypothetical protein n=1 Tax=unclassified Mesorhizobium TaxID=325217 RepID=UPI001FDAC7F0|nr:MULTISPECIES: hypothetical protein [unclassified Mesorhizobium]WJI84415.1 hypothetical protein NLY34_30445 [Mesorhizobium sp. C374B]WJI90471.1 hypothetical protein NLY42_01190 [Mesorhizobium sp. C372A]